MRVQAAAHREWRMMATATRSCMAVTDAARSQARSLVQQASRRWRRRVAAALLAWRGAMTRATAEEASLRQDTAAAAHVAGAASSGRGACGGCISRRGGRAHGHGDGGAHRVAAGEESVRRRRFVSSLLCWRRQLDWNFFVCSSRLVLLLRLYCCSLVVSPSSSIPKPSPLTLTSAPS
jgi:hypothetical protein